MNKWLRRTLGMGLGLVLGWQVAGMATGTGSWSRPLSQPVAMAETEQHHEAGTKAEASHATHESGEAGHHAVAMLVPAADDIRWYPCVLTAAAALFAAAVVLGVPAMALKGPEKAESQPHGHDGGGHHH
ncbi:MAG: hypothetical protein IT440_02870 [Phycisphaeraceae bacterium]|nr:hypothetical protein [Phycisphaeraceae bacterium]